MLERLTIENYALINKSVIDFNSGFTVITGETGAGKSIMLDALSLLMGARADSKAMGDREKKTIVEAIFSRPDPSIKEIIEELGIDWDEKELILRREISPSGKSRGFVNDSPVNLSPLSEISRKLLDIHSQHSNNLLNSSEEQINIIDAFGQIYQLLNDYKYSFRKYVSLRNKIKKIKETINKVKDNEEFLKFRLEHLDRLKPRKGELVQLEREAEILGDADRIKSDLSESFEILGGDANSALRLIQNASILIDRVDFELLDPEGKDNLKERIANLKIELRDITDTLGSYHENISSDSERLDKVQKRIDSLNETMKRFKVKNEDELVDLHIHLKEELETIDGDHRDISSMETRLKDLAKDLKEKAEKLTQARLEASLKFSEVVKEKIKPLGLPNINFAVKMTKNKFSSDGQDLVTFYCSFNKSHPLQPLSEIASGGEISRTMLGIKSIMAESMNLPTIIFDEIDNGVSGEIAHKMGNLMKEMAEKIQVIAVTHLPQVAASGHNHLKVYKSDDNGKTISHIRQLTEEERIQEIAGMLSGTSIGEAAIENAKILLSYQ